MKTGIIIDDDVTYSRILKRVLERHGFDVYSIADAENALEAVRQHSPDFALVDLKLEKSSGLHLIKPLRETKADMRIVIVTGYASVTTAVDAIKLGADDYLPKPVTLQGILRTLRKTEAPRAAQEPAARILPLERFEWEHIQQALAIASGNITRAAQLLGMPRRTLQRKLNKKPRAH